MGSGQTVIFHVDVNSAFLSWEAVYRLKHLGGGLDLRTIPAAVGGDAAKRHGIILASSMPAKACKIRTGQTVAEAVRRCPGLYLVPPNYGLYQRSSDAFFAILRQYSPAVEPYSVDEAYMDMSGTAHLYGGPVRAADEIRQRIFEELGFTVNVGVGDNKLTAKMASEFEKPYQTHTLFREEIPKKLWPLPVGDLFYVGRATAAKLIRLGIHTVGDLARSEPKWLKGYLGKHGETIWGFANGIDNGEVLDQPEPNKGYGNSATIPFDVTGRETARHVLLSLAETVAARLRADGVRIRVVSVTIRNCFFETHGHQVTCSEPTDITEEIWQYACKAFEESWDGTPIRHLGIHTAGVSGSRMRQLGLFDEMDYEKKERMDRAVDEIRERFGHDAVMRASFLGSQVDHMNGGISREKRSVDYRKVHVD